MFFHFFLNKSSSLHLEKNASIMIGTEFGDNQEDHTFIFFLFSMKVWFSSKKMLPFG